MIAITETEDREDQERVLRIQDNQKVNICLCGDECDPGQDRCPACQREEVRGKSNYEWTQQYR
jgi:hypothetical protein